MKLCAVPVNTFFEANMVSNLMVVLCSEEATQPIINTGSLY